MSTYNKQFELSVKDVDLIERSMRFQISHLARTETSFQTQESIENHKKIVELMNVLSAFHNQKIWYGQAHHTGVPLG
jgi:tRNA 2-selenouridine synthase SelU